MLGLERNVSIEYFTESEVSITPECATPRWSNHAAHAFKSDRAGTAMVTLSGPVRLSSAGSPRFASWWCSPIMHKVKKDILDAYDQAYS